MHFIAEERKTLLEIKGVGSVVIERFEEIGIHSLEQLRKYEADDIAEMVADMLGTTCWKNSLNPKKRLIQQLNWRKTRYEQKG